MKRFNAGFSAAVVATGMLVSASPYAQLSHNLSIGNPVALSMGNTVTAYPQGPDSIHYNPAGLALINQKYEQFKVQMAFFNHEGTVSGRAPGESYDKLDNQNFSQDPLLQGQLSRDVSVDSPSVYLPFFGHARLPFLVAPGYGFALRSENEKFVFANSAFALQIFGYERDADNVAAFNGQRFGITRLAYFNPSVGFEWSENFYVGGSIGFSWQGLGVTSRTRSVVNTVGNFASLLDNLKDQAGVDLGVSLNPYNDVGTLKVEVEDPLSVAFTLGMLWHPTPWLSIGATYQSEGKARMEGDFQLSYTDSFNGLMKNLQPADDVLTAVADGGTISGDQVQSGEVAMDYVQPQWASVGVSMLVTPQWRVNMDVKWVDYSVLEELVFEFDQPLDYLILASVVNNVAELYSGAIGGDYADPDVLRLQRQYEAVVDVSVGVEYAYNDNLKLRAGYEPRSSSIPEDRQDLLIPIGDADLYTVGFGYRLSNDSHVDMAFGYLVSEIHIEPGESRNATSMIEGDVVYNPYRGLKIDHTLEAYVFSLTYSSYF
jgi:long-subunit fatty acid transport protein